VGHAVCGLRDRRVCVGDPRVGIQILMDRVVEAAAAHERRIGDRPSQPAIEVAEDDQPTSANRAGRQLKIFYATQPATKPP